MNWINHKLFWILVLLLFVFSCKNITNKSIRYSSEYTNGKVVNRLEDGYWKYPSHEGKGLVKEGYYNMGLKEGVWKYYIDSEERLINWKRQELDSKFKLSFPSDWTVIKDSTKVFLGAQNDLEYIVIIAQEANAEISGLSSYLRYVYQIMKKDSIDVFTGYTINKVTFENEKETYSGQLFTKKDGVDFVNFFFYTTDYEKNILDITYRTKAVDLEYKQALFNDFVYGIFWEEKKLFYVDDFVKSNNLIEL